MHDPADILLRPEKRDAIHRAVLAGLLGNVGQKTETHEYAGPRGQKFSLFPGSALFTSGSSWVMSAEIVETTRLYARTNARIRPDWIERVGAHLLKRQYSEPFWKPTTGHVMAFERVTLYGLVIVPRRAVHYGPIAPAAAREMFIHHALIEMDYHTLGQFFKHNRNLVDDVLYLEAKTRRRDLLAAREKRFAFFDARVPKDIFSGPAFEKWRDAAERKNPNLLFMSEDDLLDKEASATSNFADFPDQLILNSPTLHIPLSYLFDPSHEMDGTTATIPLAALNQIPTAAFDWLVLGHLENKITALIRSLPKTLRVNFVPVPHIASAAFAALRTAFPDPTSPPPASFPDALATQLGKMTGLTVRPSDFKPDTLPDYLHMNFRIADDSGNTVAVGRNLDALRKQLGLRAKTTFANLPKTKFHRDQITHWDFGDLPERIEVNVNNVALNAYPALIDDGATVAMRLFDDPDAAQRAHRAGVRRLFANQLREEIRHLTRMTPTLEQMSLQYVTLGTSDDLRHYLAAAISDRALFAEDLTIRTQNDFVERASAGWRRLTEASNEILAIAEESLRLYHHLALELSQDFPPLLAPAASDMREHRADLMTKDFLTAIPFSQLKHLPRYLRAIDTRMTKLRSGGAHRDTAAMTELRPFVEQYRLRAHRHRIASIHDPHLDIYRWMLEEFRVSLFAQELKTPIPVSQKRLEFQWEKVKSAD